VDPADTVAYYHCDGLGSTRALSDAAGQRTDSYNYGVFGDEQSHNGDTSQPFGFRGEQQDDATGLTFLCARYYDPQVGRFISADTWPVRLDDSQIGNRFHIANNNPPASRCLWIGIIVLGSAN
jgi:RHS repeat-associated protein